MQEMVSLFQILLFVQQVLGTIMPTIRSWRALYRWLLPVVFGAVFYSYFLYYFCH